MPTNYTIDDSDWDTPNVTLSAGWNMLQQGGDNEYINSTQVDAITPLLSQFHNQSLSWTTTLGSNTTLLFVGTDIWAYGVAGPDQGTYTVQLDGGSTDAYTAQTDTLDTNYLVYAAHNLDDSVTHRLVLVNGLQDASLAFDYAIVQRGDLVPTASTSTATSTSSSASTPSFTATPSANGSALSGLLNTTSPGTHQELGGGSSQVSYTPQQLALLSEGYHFHWTASAYFVVIFASCISAIVALGLLYQLLIRMRKQSKGATDTYLITAKRPRPNTRLLDALRKGKISNPVPSEDGDSRRRSSQTTATYVEGRLGKEMV